MLGSLAWDTAANGRYIARNRVRERESRVGGRTEGGRTRGNERVVKRRKRTARQQERERVRER